MKYIKPLLVGVLAAFIIYFYLNDWQNYLTLEYAQKSLGDFRSYDLENPFKAKLIFFLLYFFMVTLSIPGSLILTLFAGALFGFLYGVLLVSFASSIGASLAFLSSRYILRDWVQRKFHKKYEAINRGFLKVGIPYIFSLRLIPVVPFFLVNILLGLTQLRLRTFYWVSQLGMLPATFVYVKAGEEISRISSLKDILSAEFLLVFSLLALLPFVFKRILSSVRP